jgi:putative transposase
MGFIDTMRSAGHAVESVCRVLREQGCQVAARTYRAWRARRPAARTHSDAQLIDAIKDTCWRRDESGTLRLTRKACTGGASSLRTCVAVAWRSRSARSPGA